MNAFPLLARELVERAAQPRTYVLRATYAALVFTPFLIFFFRLSPDETAGWLGMGRKLFVIGTALQMAGIYLFLPALMCGAIAQEKERNSLDLLLLTQLSPRDIILQKYFGGLVPMFSFLALSLPIIGLSYSLGGLTTGELVVGVWFLALTALHVGAIALFASVWCATTPGAYLLACLLAFPGPAVALIFASSARGLMSWLWLTSAFIPPLGWLELVNANRVDLHEIAILYSAPTLIVIAGLLFAACELLIVRAGLPAPSGRGSIFGRLDGMATRPRRTMFPRRAGTLPENDPIAWMEGTRNALVQPGHAVRIGVALECVVVPTGLLVAGFRFGAEQTILLLEYLIALLGTLAILGVTVLGANAFITERVKQTLEVLLTTPLSAAQMMCQKASVVHRLMFAGLLPIGSLAAIIGISQATDLAIYRFDPQRPWLFVIAALLSFMIDVPLAWWLSVWLSARARTRLPAMLRALGGVLAFVALPSVLLGWAGLLGFHLSRAVAGGLVLISPVEIFRICAGYGRGGLFGDMWPLALVGHLVFCGIVLLLVQQRCLRRAETWLRG